MEQENKYARGKIYKIISNETDQIYIGSTTEPTLARRLSQHRGSYQHYKDGKRNFVSSFALLKLNHYQIILLESYPCNSKDELNAREQYHIDQNKDVCVNLYKAFTGIKAETKQDYDKEYRTTNVEQIKDNKKQYYVKNKEQIKENNKEYYEENKHDIQAKQSQKVKCECGSSIRKNDYARHTKSLKHIHFLNHEWDNLHELI